MKILKNIIVIFYVLSIVSCGIKDSTLKFESKTSPKVGAVVTKAEHIEAFKETVYPLVKSMNCVDCHGDSKKYQPYYAVSDVSQAWDTILNDSKKVNLDDPEASRMYLRLKIDHHNCLKEATDLNCDEEASTMLTAIKRWKDLTTHVNDNSAFKTDPIVFQSTELSLPEEDYGTLIFEGEQPDFPEAMVGRFIPELDGKASGFKYALTPLPLINPATSANRTPELRKGNACEVTTPNMLTNSINGPYRVIEEGTHINSDKRTSKGLIIKDGQRPFSIAVSSMLIRPDKRMDYAKMLTGWAGNSASGVANIGVTSAFALTKENFDVTSIDIKNATRPTGMIDVSSLPLTGVPVNEEAFKILPYFINRNSVFQSGSNNFINDPKTILTNHLGVNFELKNLFKLPMPELRAVDVLSFFEKNDTAPLNDNHFRRDIMFKYVNDQLTSFTSNNNYRYKNIEGMDKNHFFSLYGKLKVNIKACSGACDASALAVQVTPETDNDGVALTYENHNDILKVNANGDGFISGTTTELAQGKAFRRLDVYVHHNFTPDALKFGDAFDQVFYNSTGAEKASINFPLNVNDENLDLRAMFLNGANSLTKEESLKNFQTSLYPILQKSSCISCHDGNTALRVQHASSNPVIAFNEIERLKLVNFATPANSFRKVIYPGDATMGHNCGASDRDCLKTQADFLAGINQWKIANNASASANSSQPYQELSEAERSPGMLSYKFKINKTGYYNIWTKVKTANNFKINLRVLDNATPISAFKKIINPTRITNSCVEYTIPEYTDWTWFTPTRDTELKKLDSLGTLKKDNAGKLLTLEDDRTYWLMEAGKTYTLQIFEAAVQTKIDMVAIDYVANHKDVLDFQPDLLARDENNIADYKKRVLKYDISKLVGLKEGSAFFKVEVKASLDGQGYIFRNPRISSEKSISVKKVRVFVNGTTSFSDASWNNINIVAGDDKVITFSPLIALTKYSPTTDFFQFTFEKIEQTDKTISELDPRGSAPRLVEGRKCRELDLFLNTVKPILRNARLMLKDDMGVNKYLDAFPGFGRGGENNPNTYQCMTCHSDNHPYFKMTTFDYPEILCAQALSRVDFTNYRESLLVRGLDGSGVHPKLHFVEELMYAPDSKSILSYDPDDGARILSGQIKNQFNGTSPAYFSRWIQNYYFGLYTKEDFGTNANWNSNSEEQKNLARKFVGQFKRVQHFKIKRSDIGNYESFTHDKIIGEILTERDNPSQGIFVEQARPIYDTYIPNASDTDATLNNRYMEIIAKKISHGPGYKVAKDGADKTIFETTLTRDQMNDKVEDLKTKYRNVILGWIEKEHEHIKKGQ